MAATESDGTPAGGGTTDAATTATAGTGSGTASAPAPASGTQTATTLDPAAISWAAPGERDSFALYGAITLVFIVFVVIYLYAVFDRFAGKRGLGTPLRTTIPTMLTLGLAYDLLPLLDSVNILLPAALIVAALARDIALWIQPGDPVEREEEAFAPLPPVVPQPEPVASPPRPTATKVVAQEETVE